MSDGIRGDRPLSPHLQIYRLPAAAVLSILHRLSGLAIALGALYVVGWFLAAAAGPTWYSYATSFTRSIVGMVILFGCSAALCYHLCNGVRHLIWDAGWGFSLRAARISGWTTVAATAFLTVALWAWILG